MVLLLSSVSSRLESWSSVPCSPPCSYIKANSKEAEDKRERTREVRIKEMKAIFDVGDYAERFSPSSLIVSIDSWNTGKWCPLWVGTRKMVFYHAIPRLRYYQTMHGNFIYPCMLGSMLSLQWRLWCWDRSLTHHTFLSKPLIMFAAPAEELMCTHAEQSPRWVSSRLPPFSFHNLFFCIIIFKLLLILSLTKHVSDTHAAGNIECILMETKHISRLM